MEPCSTLAEPEQSEDSAEVKAGLYANKAGANLNAAEK
jgi:hypothetical protein